jgi:hypothetical protein
VSYKIHLFALSGKHQPPSFSSRFEATRNTALSIQQHVTWLHCQFISSSSAEQCQLYPIAACWATQLSVTCAARPVCSKGRPRCSSRAVNMFPSCHSVGSGNIETPWMGDRSVWAQHTCASCARVLRILFWFTCHVFGTCGLKRTKPEANVAAFRFEPLMHCYSLNKGLIVERCGGQVN